MGRRQSRLQEPKRNALFHLFDTNVERKASLVGAQISTILDLAQENKLHQRNPSAKAYLHELDTLAMAPVGASYCSTARRRSWRCSCNR